MDTTITDTSFFTCIFLQTSFRIIKTGKRRRSQVEAVLRIRRSHTMQKFEWLTEEICKEYIERTKALPPDNGTDVGAWRELRIELQKRCNLTEIEAFNILRGYHVETYLQLYRFESGEIPLTEALLKRKQKEEKKKKKSLKEKLQEYEAQIDELEQIKEARLPKETDYSFEERD